MQKQIPEMSPKNVSTLFLTSKTISLKILRIGSVFETIMLKAGYKGLTISDVEITNTKLLSLGKHRARYNVVHDFHATPEIRAVDPRPEGFAASPSPPTDRFALLLTVTGSS